MTSTPKNPSEVKLLIFLKILGGTSCDTPEPMYLDPQSASGSSTLTSAPMTPKDVRRKYSKGLMFGTSRAIVRLEHAVKHHLKLYRKYETRICEEYESWQLTNKTLKNQMPPSSHCNLTWQDGCSSMSANINVERTKHLHHQWPMINHHFFTTINTCQGPKKPIKQWFFLFL